MALTNSEKQAEFRARQKNLAADQAKTIAEQCAQIGALTKQLQAATEANHALEIKLLKMQQKRK